MDFSRFDKYHKVLLAAALLIALLTYWRFREIDVSEAYSYVAQQNVIHPILQQSFARIASFETRSMVWDFFGLLGRTFVPDSIIVVRLAGLLLTVLNYFLLTRLLNQILDQRFWGFLGVFLVSLSPFMTVAAVSGLPAASAVTITLLYLIALYKNQYVFAGMLSGIGVAANLPGLIMFLILVLDLLQNSLTGDLRAAGKKKIIREILSSAAGFLGVILVVFLYSAYAGTARLSSVPLQERDVPWSLLGAVPLVVVGIVDIAGIIYLIAARRFDICRIHFHTLMLWISFGALCVVQPTVLNLSTAFIVSSLLAVYFVRGFASIWNLKFLSVETFVFLFVVSFLFSDIYANNRFLGEKVLADCREKTQAVNELIDSLKTVDDDSQIVSNFAPSELSVRLVKPVLEINGEPFPLENVNIPGRKTIYIVDKISKVDSSYRGCKLLVRTNYEFEGHEHFVEVIQCEGMSNE
ncbi:MAG TPA: hypothetical protein VLX91_07575 [Candidatus Acidoferrales bacterium]|nr:hypothetical protein [Candidatus Acidoferrales bacterium]